MCAGCRQLKPKAELIRIALTDRGAEVDRSGKLGGRGVYVCRNSACVTRMHKARKSRSAGNGCISDAVYRELQEIAEHE